MQTVQRTACLHLPQTDAVKTNTAPFGQLLNIMLTAFQRANSKFTNVFFKKYLKRIFAGMKAAHSPQAFYEKRIAQF